MKHVLVALLLLCLLPSYGLARPVTWEWLSPAPQGEYLSAVAYGAGLFVAVGHGGTILTSPDGTNWTRRTIPFRAHLADVAFADGLFVAVGNLRFDKDENSKFPPVILTSPDGITWTPRLASARSLELAAVAYGGGRWVVGAGHPDGVVLVSDDAVTWTEVPVGRDIGTRGLAYGNGQFLMVGYYHWAVSADGLSWTVMENRGLTAFFGGGLFVVAD
ncbi:MAG TPA: hypothetical protein VD902_15490, partial [Symbiobacteriaceae bacterium]|nr:hypothetical protein [Symbiobacteriaceae bacterium]